MSVLELISIIMVCVTTLVAIAAFIVPLIVNGWNNRRMEKQQFDYFEFKEKQLKAEQQYNEQKLKAEQLFNEQKLESERRYNERKQEFDRVFDEQFKIINDYDVAYSEWKLNGDDQAFILAINNTSALLKNKFTRYKFDHLAQKVLNKEEKHSIRAAYEVCRSIIFEFLGLEDSQDENALIKDQLRKAVCKKLDFTPYS